MPNQPLDLSHTEKPQQVQANMIAYMQIFAGLPGVHMHDTDDSFWIVSKDECPGNIILKTRWTNPGSIEQQIDDLLAQIGQYLDTIDWFVFPGDLPEDLGQRLEKRGMLGGPGGNWLWTDLTKHIDAPPVDGDFRIELIKDDAMMAEWVQATTQGFGMDLRYVYDAYARHGYGPDAFSLHYTGYLGDIPVTTGTLLDAGGCATIYDVSTLPDYRKQGFGSALMHYMMRVISDRGYQDTWIWSSDMAKSMYQSLGYVDVDFGLREHSWRKAASNG
ncbi:MAG: GNAT family N-acetyltransferase [Anaerolineaceae bacterium]|nr:GNAT family N-acetyltransferase [Anaerolineaceae bacterium]